MSFRDLASGFKVVEGSFINDFLLWNLKAGVTKFCDYLNDFYFVDDVKFLPTLISNSSLNTNLYMSKR